MASDSPLYVFAGGGTGGHLFPGLAVAQRLQQENRAARFTFVGSERSLERALVVQHGFTHHTLPSEPLNQLSRRPWSFFWRNWQAYRRGRTLLLQNRPTAVIGLGGFASAPVILAASRLGLPTVLLEQNSIPGKSTRWLSRWANVVCLAYPQSVGYFRPQVMTRLTGNPLRDDIAALAHETRFETPPPTLLILGGSQGAQPVNEAVLEMFRTDPEFLEDWQIVHQTGAAQSVSVMQAYQQIKRPAEVAPFFHDLSRRYHRATLIVSRAGATTLAELACAGVPPILIPYPQSADNHQWHNAQALAEAGASVVCPQAATPLLTAVELRKQLQELADSPSRRADMSEALRSLATPDATTQVVQAIHDVSR